MFRASAAFLREKDGEAHPPDGFRSLRVEMIWLWEGRTTLGLVVPASWRVL